MRKAAIVGAARSRLRRGEDESGTSEEPTDLRACPRVRLERDLRGAAHQIRQTFSFTIGCGGAQAKAAANSGMFTTTPLMR